MARMSLRDALTRVQYLFLHIGGQLYVFSYYPHPPAALIFEVINANIRQMNALEIPFFFYMVQRFQEHTKRLRFFNNLMNKFQARSYPIQMTLFSRRPRGSYSRQDEGIKGKIGTSGSLQVPSVLITVIL